MDAFSEVRLSVSNTLITALTKLNHSHKTMDDRLNEISKKLKDQTNQLNISYKIRKPIIIRNAASKTIMANVIAEIEGIIVVAIAVTILATEVAVTKIEDDLGRTLTAELTISQIKSTKVRILFRYKRAKHTHK